MRSLDLNELEEVSGGEFYQSPLFNGLDPIKGWTGFGEKDEINEDSELPGGG